MCAMNRDAFFFPIDTHTHLQETKLSLMKCDLHPIRWMETSHPIAELRVCIREMQGDSSNQLAAGI